MRRFGLQMLVVFAVGAVLGTALDHLHVLTGVLTYPPRTLITETLWPPVLFGLGGLAMFWPFRLLFRRGAKRWVRRGPLAFYLFVFAFAYSITALLKDWPVVVLLVLLGAWLPLVIRTPPILLHGLAVAVAGTLVEAGLSASGSFHYLAPGLLPYLHVPLWLPALYLHAGLAAHALDLGLFHAPAAQTLPVLAPVAR